MIIYIYIHTLTTNFYLDDEYFIHREMLLIPVISIPGSMRILRARAMQVHQDFQLPATIESAVVMPKQTVQYLGQWPGNHKQDDYQAIHQSENGSREYSSLKTAAESSSLNTAAESNCLKTAAE